MATKSKPAAKKSAARKPAPHKHAAHKPAVAKKKVEPAHKPAVHPPAKAASHPAPAEKPAPKPAAPHRAAESVSLIDKKQPEKKAADGDLKKKTTVLPPISRIRASLETPTVPLPKKTESPPPAPPAPPIPPVAGSESEPEEPKNVIHIKPPIIV